jgi:PAS domain S-box-containing protein
MKKKTTPQNPVSSMPELVCPDYHREAIISMNNSLDIKSWNKGAERIYGIEKREAMDRPLPSVIFFAFIENNAGSFLEELSRNGQWQGETMYIRKDRIVVFAHVCISAVKDSLGITIGYVAIVGEEAKEDSGNNQFTPIFDAEYRFVGLVNTRESQAWEMVLHWEE